MLNYIWAGLIIFSLVFALAYDTRDLFRDTYRNGQAFAVTLDFQDGYSSDARRQDVTVRIDAAWYRSHYDVDVAPDAAFAGTLIQNADGRQLQFARDAALPEPLATIRSMISKRDNDLRGTVSFAGQSSAPFQGTVLFPEVRFVKLTAITQAAIDFAETAVSIALGLIGVMALWMGLLRIAEKSGMIHLLVRLTQPVFRRLFPEIPKDHPAMGMIILNLTANMLGLANAATPLGIKAMESLQELNPEKDTATNSMVMLLSMNTASVQIVPPTLLVAIMGLQINQLFFSILITTSLSLVIAVTMTKTLEKLKRYRATDPMAGASQD